MKINIYDVISLVESAKSCIIMLNNTFPNFEELVKELGQEGLADLVCELEILKIESSRLYDKIQAATFEKRGKF